MEKEFLESLGIEEAAVTAILEAAQETETAHQRALAQVRFEATLEQAVTRAGGKNLKAIRALLDEETLFGADDQAAAIAQAMKTLKKECGYLFDSPTPPAYAPGTGTRQNTPADEPKSLADALREKFKKKS